MAHEWQSSAHLAKLRSLSEKRRPPGAASLGLQAEPNPNQLILHRPSRIPLRPCQGQAEGPLARYPRPREYC